MLASCNQKEEIGEAKAVGANESYVVFAATGAPSQTLSVYADGSWAVDVNQPWIQVSPMTGQGMGSITVSVADNATGGVIDSPREGTIILQGRFRERRMVITVHQIGDNYYGVEEQTLAQVAALDDDAYAKVPDAQVVALSQNGFIAADESASLYVQGTGPALGDKLSFNGKKISVNGAPAFEMDEFQVNGNSAVVYPEAKDITASDGNVGLEIPAGMSLTLDLAGHTLDRGLKAAKNDGYVLGVSGSLTVKDSVGGGKITGGWSSQFGGGIYVDYGASLTVAGGEISGNQAFDGGGIGAPNGTIVISGGKISGNRAYFGGGVWLSGTLKMKGGKITNNDAFDPNEETHIEGGGGVCGYNADIIISGGEISENRANGIELTIMSRITNR